MLNHFVLDKCFISLWFFVFFFADHNRLVGSGTPTASTTTILQATPRKIDTSPRGTISPKTTKRVLLSHTSSPHSIQNASTHHPTGGNVQQNDRLSFSKAHSNASQIERIVNNGKIDSCLNGIAPNVSTATIATSTIDVVDPNLIRANKGVAALAVLVKYLADDVSIHNWIHLFCWVFFSLAKFEWSARGYSVHYNWLKPWFSSLI